MSRARTERTTSLRLSTSTPILSQGRRLLSAAIHAAVLLFALGTSRASAVCIPSGSEIPINAALVGAGASAELCPNAVFNLLAPVRFTAPNQRLSTQGLPTGSSRALLRVTGTGQTLAIDGNNQAGVIVESLRVDGNRTGLGPLTGSALLEMGGGGSGQTVRNIAAYDTRSWSLIHFFEGTVTGGTTPQCQNAAILNNTLGPAGTPGGLWADGISLACGNSLVQGNTITDATDGAIVIFGAPGSLIQNNTIVAVSRELLGGINMVDYGPVTGNYSGTRVLANTIVGQSAFIKVGIAMGPQIWSCTSGTNYGATVSGNSVQGLIVGYGYAVNGVRSWTVTGNSDTARHVGALAAGCGGTPSRPAAFQYGSIGTGTALQSEFRAATLNYLLGVTEPAVLRAAGPSTSCGTLFANQGLYPDQQILSCDGRFRLLLQLDGNLVLYQGSTPLWASGTVGQNSAVAIEQGDGNFVIYDASGTPIWATGTFNRPGARLLVQNDGNLVIYDAANVPRWASNTCCH